MSHLLIHFKYFPTNSPQLYWLSLNMRMESCGTQIPFPKLNDVVVLQLKWLRYFILHFLNQDNKLWNQWMVVKSYQRKLNLKKENTKKYILERTSLFKLFNKHNETPLRRFFIWHYISMTISIPLITSK